MRQYPPAPSEREGGQLYRGSTHNLLGATSARGGEESYPNVMTSAKKIHERAESMGVSRMGDTPMKARSTLGAAAAAMVGDGSTKSKQRSLSGMDHHSLYGVSEKSSPFVQKASERFGIEGYFLPKTVNDTIKVPIWH